MSIVKKYTNSFALIYTLAYIVFQRNDLPLLALANSPLAPVRDFLGVYSHDY